MNDLVIRFDGQELAGKGWDCVGEFTLQGKLTEDSSVKIVKQYVGRHAVVYEGTHDGEGMIYGAWALWGDHGTFAMRAAGGFQAVDEPIAEWKP